jgi:hypothetical protein
MCSALRALPPTYDIRLDTRGGFLLGVANFDDDDLAAKVDDDSYLQTLTASVAQLFACAYLVPPRDMHAHRPTAFKGEVTCVVYHFDWHGHDALGTVLHLLGAQLIRKSAYQATVNVKVASRKVDCKLGVRLGGGPKSDAYVLVVHTTRHIEGVHSGK